MCIMYIEGSSRETGRAAGRAAVQIAPPEILSGGAGGFCDAAFLTENPMLILHVPV